MLMHDPASTIKLVNDQPFPHTLPKNETPYFNHSEPAGFDGPGECLRWVYAPKFGYEPVAWAVDEVDRHLFDFDQTEFWDAETNGTGVQETGQVYIRATARPTAWSRASSSSCSASTATSRATRRATASSCSGSRSTAGTPTPALPGRVRGAARALRRVRPLSADYAMQSASRCASPVASSGACSGGSDMTPTR